MSDDPPTGVLQERVDVYAATVARMEPDIAMVDGDGARASMAISLRRIADSLDTLTTLLTAPGLGKLIEELRPIVERLGAEE